MNNVRRKKLASIQEQLEELKDSLEEVLTEEEEGRDNLPENLLGSERWNKADAACNQLQEAIDEIESALTCIEAAQE